MQTAVLNCQTHSYHRREPEKEVLYQAIADNLETFLERLRAEGHELPEYVVRRRPSGYGEMFQLRRSKISP
jgi:hypothetical protein